LRWTGADLSGEGVVLDRGDVPLGAGACRVAETRRIAAGVADFDEVVQGIVAIGRAVSLHGPFRPRKRASKPSHSAHYG